jgi:glycerol uptake facilitator-like aquaporin
MVQAPLSKLEYRRLFSELLGTCMLVLVAAGGGLLHGEGQISLPAAVVAPGLMMLAIILFMGAVSGAHLNPAVSLAFAVRGDFPWKRVPGYIITQLLGATLACLFLLAVFGNIQHLGAIGVGGYIALAGLWSAPVSATSMNPARSFGPALVSGDPISRAAGAGVLTPGDLEKKDVSSCSAESSHRGRRTHSARAITRPSRPNGVMLAGVVAKY